MFIILATCYFENNYAIDVQELILDKVFSSSNANGIWTNYSTETTSTNDTGYQLNVSRASIALLIIDK